LGHGVYLVGGYFNLGIFGILGSFMLFDFVGIVGFFPIFSISFPSIPERVAAPSSPIRISGEPILIVLVCGDGFGSACAVAFAALGFAGAFAGVATIGFFLL
jgi:hypothetical protein